MSCGCRSSEPSGRVSDTLETGGARRPFDHSATAWLVGQGVRYLNTDDKEGELAYQRVVELLRHCAEDLVETVTGLLRAAPAGDAPLRWCLLHVLGDAAGPRAAELLVQLAIERLPESNVDEGCEGLRDAELLVRTMAVHAMGRIAGRHQETRDQVLKIVSASSCVPTSIGCSTSAGRAPRRSSSNPSAKTARSAASPRLGAERW
jgi:hypothetical protein